MRFLLLLLFKVGKSGRKKLKLQTRCYSDSVSEKWLKLASTVAKPL